MASMISKEQLYIYYLWNDCNNFIGQCQNVTLQYSDVRPQAYAIIIYTDVLAPNKLQAISINHADFGVIVGYNISHKPFYIT